LPPFEIIDVLLVVSLKGAVMIQRWIDHCCGLIMGILIGLLSFELGELQQRSASELLKVFNLHNPSNQLGKQLSNNNELQSFLRRMKSLVVCSTVAARLVSFREAPQTTIKGLRLHILLSVSFSNQ
jgi:hypothetical protein